MIEFCMILCCDRNFYVATWFSGFKRQGLAMGKGLVLQRIILVTTETGQGRKIIRHNRTFILETERTTS